MTGRTLALATGALIAGFGIGLAPAQAQGRLHDRVDVDLPYAITLGSNTLQPGQYVIRELPSSTTRRVLLIYGDNGAKYETMVNTIPAYKNLTPDETKVTLHHYGPDYYFDKIWIAGKNYGYEFPVPASVKEREREREGPISVSANYLPPSTETAAATPAPAPEPQTTQPENQQTAQAPPPPPQQTAPAQQENQQTAQNTAPPPQQAAPEENQQIAQNNTPPPQANQPAPEENTANREAQQNNHNENNQKLPATSADWVMMLLGGGGLSGLGLALRRKR